MRKCFVDGGERTRTLQTLAVGRRCLLRLVLVEDVSASVGTCGDETVGGHAAWLKEEDVGAGTAASTRSVHAPPGCVSSSWSCSDAAAAAQWRQEPLASAGKAGGKSKGKGKHCGRSGYYVENGYMDSWGYLQPSPRHGVSNVFYVYCLLYLCIPTTHKTLSCSVVVRIQQGRTRARKRGGWHARNQEMNQALIQSVVNLSDAVVQMVDRERVR